MYTNPYMTFPGITAEEMVFLQQCTTGLDEKQLHNFYSLYSAKRRNSQDVLLMCLLGFFGFAGVHRMMLGQVGMGIVYFFTAGFCFIGTVVDLINIKALTDEYNQKMAFETIQIIKMGFGSY
ncbi:TM2 domain-containing protein [Mucilaginibacter sp. HMF5004]|uniref:TM2 domain-containing protein n=1 Tax=Mucilaginibacter rivuli TaxID=2857527 RepID=UPI001C604756|nr:TM2 domain-containing protein [Mucilaginibacter rivuli]MBW4891056.1 TM2 domain-containing protein [Mucilaginibacter rivuli]